MAKDKQNLIWHRLFEAGEMGVNFLKAGKSRLVRINDKPYLVIRRGDELFCVRHKCPHQGASLEYARINEKGDIVCPWHRFSFCIKTGKNTSGEGFYLDTYPIEIRDDGVYIGLEKRKWLGLF